MIKIAIKDTFFEEMLTVKKGSIIFIMIYNIYQEEWKLKNAASLYAICTIKINMSHTISIKIMD